MACVTKLAKTSRSGLAKQLQINKEFHCNNKGNLDFLNNDQGKEQCKQQSTQNTLGYFIL